VVCASAPGAALVEFITAAKRATSRFSAWQAARALKRFL
jgi:hypothetical protein